MANHAYKIQAKEKLKSMSDDKDIGENVHTGKLIKKSRIVRSKSLREMASTIKRAIGTEVCFLDDSECIAIKRIATSKFLDFPHVLRGVYEGTIPVGSAIERTKIAEFLSGIPGGHVFVLLEPWVYRGIIQLKPKLLESNFWSILEASDFSIKIYDLELSKSCILEGNEDDSRLNFAIFS